MAKECIDYCPRIKSILRDIENDTFISGPLAIHPDLLGNILGSDESGAERLLKACKDSYDCSGPKLEEVQQTRGTFRKRESKRIIVCGLNPTI